MSQQNQPNMFAGYNLAELAALLQQHQQRQQQQQQLQPQQQQQQGIAPFLLAAATQNSTPAAVTPALSSKPDPPEANASANVAAAAAAILGGSTSAAAVAAPAAAAQSNGNATGNDTASGTATSTASNAASTAALAQQLAAMVSNQNQKRPAISNAEPAAKKPRKDGRSWDEMFGALVSFKARNGHCRVPLNHSDTELSLWFRQQQTRKPLLTVEERYKLDLVDFPWDESPGTATGNATPNNTTAVAAPVAAPVPVPSFATGSTASAAVASFASLIAGTAARSLQTAQPAPVASRSRNIFEQLEAYKQRIHPPSASVQPVVALNLQQQQQVGGVGGSLPESEQVWEKMFTKLQVFKALHGHCQVGLLSDSDGGGPALALWTLKQREAYQRGTIPPHHKAKLDAIGFESVEGAVAAVATVAAAGARLNTAGSTSENKAGIAAVAAAATAAEEEAEAPKKRVRTFDENFNALLEYKKVHGNVDVPQKYDKDRRLGIWVKNVRQHPNRHSEEQRARLDSIGFKWRKLQLDAQWNDAFKQLLEYKDKYGDCNVPSRWKKCPALARWVHTQRTMYRRNKLLEDRKEKLEEAGFVWDCNAMRDDEAFHENYEKLRAFKKAKGHANIPNKYRRDRPLGRWAAKMRDLFAYEQLDADRLKALTDIGFVWKPSATEASSPTPSEGTPSPRASDDEKEDEEATEKVVAC